MFQNRDGQEIDLLEWGDLKEDPDYKLIAQDMVLCPDGRVIHLQTVWFGFVEPAICPCLLNFGSSADLKTVAVYNTEQDAVAGHERLKQLLLKGDQLSPAH